MYDQMRKCAKRARPSPAIAAAAAPAAAIAANNAANVAANHAAASNGALARLLFALFLYLSFCFGVEYPIRGRSGGGICVTLLDTLMPFVSLAYSLFSTPRIRLQATRPSIRTKPELIRRATRHRKSRRSRKSNPRV